MRTALTQTPKVMLQLIQDEGGAGYSAKGVGAERHCLVNKMHANVRLIIPLLRTESHARRLERLRRKGLGLSSGRCRWEGRLRRWCHGAVGVAARGRREKFFFFFFFFLHDDFFYENGR